VATNTQYDDPTRCEQCLTLTPINNFDALRADVLGVQNTIDYDTLQSVSNQVTIAERTAIVNADARELSLLLSEAHEAAAIDIMTLSSSDAERSRTLCSQLMAEVAFFVTDAGRTLTAQAQRNELIAIQLHGRVQQHGWPGAR